MTREEKYAAGFRMIHPKEGHVRCGIGIILSFMGAAVAPYSAAPLAWSDLLFAGGVMLWNMGRMSQ